jgi:hypothetical protein
MSSTTRQPEQVYAVVRFDPEAPEPQLAVTVKKILRSLELAEAEVTRLNALAGAPARYFWQATRLYPPGAAAGRAAVGARE